MHPLKLKVDEKVMPPHPLNHDKTIQFCYTIWVATCTRGEWVYLSFKIIITFEESMRVYGSIPMPP